MNQKVRKSFIRAIEQEFCPSRPPRIVPCKFDPKGISGWKRCRKTLAAAKGFSVDQSRVYRKDNEFVDGLARWGETLVFQIAAHTFRYWTLLIRRGDCGFGFAIRVVGHKLPTELPGIDYSPSDVGLLFQIADEVSERGEEIDIQLPNLVLKRTTETIQAESDVYDEEVLMRILRDGFVREAFFIGVLVGLECIQDVSGRSRFAVNFLTTRGGGSLPEENVRRILGVLDFMAESPYFGCPIIEVKEKVDLCQWEKRRGRITLLRYVSEKSIRQIWKEAERAILEEREAKFPALPLLSGRSSLPTSITYEIRLPSEGVSLATSDLKTIRSAAAHLLRQCHRICKRMQKQLDWLEVSGACFQLAYPMAYFQCFAHVVGEVLFEDTAHLQAFRDICGESHAQRLAQQEKEVQLMDKALTLLLDPERYSNEIVFKPQSKEGAKSILAADAVAFVSSSKKSPALCFSEQSLLRLLRRVGFCDVLLDRFLHGLKTKGIIQERRESIHFKKSSNDRFVTIPIDKCENFDVSMVSMRNLSEEEKENDKK